MALVLVATVGGASSNAYLDVTAAEAIVLERFGADAWDDASAGDKTKALVAATRQIDRCRFRGSKSTSTQALEFPRSPQKEALTLIPADVKEACVSQAIYLLTNASSGGASKRKTLQAEGVTSFSVGNLSETYGKTSSAGGADHLCEESRDYLKRWIDRTGTITGQRERISDNRSWWPFE